MNIPTQDPLPNVKEVCKVNFPIIEKYGSLKEKYIPEVNVYAVRINDAISTNYGTIEPYLEHVVIRGSARKRKEIDEALTKHRINFVTIGIAAAWSVGREWGYRIPALKDQYRSKSLISAHEVPEDAIDLLERATYSCYFPFAQVFVEYYNSRSGAPVRHQKEAHLIDTYKGFYDNAIIQCFMKGVQSHDLY